jgi:hypothetical protein
MILHRTLQSADVIVMDPPVADQGDTVPEDHAARSSIDGIDGDHPDPVTLGTPSYDGQGLLRWGSMPLPGALGSTG